MLKKKAVDTFSLYGKLQEQEIQPITNLQDTSKHTPANSTPPLDIDSAVGAMCEQAQYHFLDINFWTNESRNRNVQHGSKNKPAFNALLVNQSSPFTACWFATHALHVRCQFGERLPSAATNTQEKSIAQCLAQNTSNTANVLHSIQKEHKLHLGGIELIVLLHVLLNHTYKLWLKERGRIRARPKTSYLAVLS